MAQLSQDQSNVQNQTLGQQVTPTGGQKTQQKGVQQATLFDIQTNFNLPSQLSKDGKEYIDGLIQALKMDNSKINVEAITTDDIESRLIYSADGKAAVNLFFPEAAVQDENLPITEKVEHVKAAIKAADTQLLESIVIDPRSYDRIDQASKAIKAMFILREHTAAQPTREALRNTRLVFSTNKVKGAHFINKMSVHGVPCRADMALTISIQREDPAGRIDPATGQKQMETRDIAAASVYVDFIAHTGQGNFPGQIGHKYIPVVTIGEVTTSIPSKELLSLIIPAVADAFIVRGGWIEAFSRFGKNERNLGSLVTDASKNEMVNITNMDLLYKLVHEFIMEPVLAIDVVDGRARVPGLDFFNWDPIEASKNLAAWLQVPPLATQGGGIKNPVNYSYTEYIGVDGEGRDSRETDYLELAKSIKDPTRINQFLYPQSNPVMKLEMIRQFKDIDVLYTNNKVVLDNAFVMWLASQVNGFTNVTPDYMKRGMFRSDAIISADSFQNFTTFGTTQGGGGGGHITQNPYSM